MLKDILHWLYWYPFRVAIQALPISFVYCMGRIGGIVLSHIFTMKRRLFEEEINKLSPRLLDSSALSKTIQKAFIELFQSELEVLIFSKLNPGNIETVVKVSGLDNLDNALAQGRGVMLLFAHFGANQMIMPAIGHRGYRMSQLSAPPMVWVEKLPGRKFSYMAKKALELRWNQELSLPVKHINIFGSLKDAFICLKRNEILGIAIDGGGGKDRVEVGFLGRKALFSTGAIEIAMRTGCVVLPAFMVRDKDGHNTMIIEKPLQLIEREVLNTACTENMKLFIKRLEEYVLNYPYQYLNFLVLRNFMVKQGDAPFFIGDKQ